MKKLIIILITIFVTSIAHAKFMKRHYVPNPGDIKLSIHGNVYNYNINSDVRETNSEVLFFGYAKAGYHLVNGLYVGGSYHRIDDDNNEKNTFGVGLEYVYKIFHIGAQYLFYSNHKYRDFTGTPSINAELEKGNGFLLDASLNFPLSWNFYVGLGVTYHTLKYDEVDYEDTGITDSSISDEEHYFVPMIQFTYFLGTHGKRIHEKGSIESKKKPSLKKSKSRW